VAVFLKVAAHCPYRGYYWGRYGESPSPHLVWLLNAAKVTDISFPSDDLHWCRTEYEYTWRKTVLQINMSTAMSICPFGFNPHSARQVRHTFDQLSRSRAYHEPSRLAFAGPHLGSGRTLFLGELTAQGTEKFRSEKVELYPLRLTSLPSIERGLRRDGHTILDLRDLQRYRLPHIKARPHA